MNSPGMIFVALACASGRIPSGTHVPGGKDGPLRVCQAYQASSGPHIVIPCWAFWSQSIGFVIVGEAHFHEQLTIAEPIDWDRKAEQGLRGVNSSKLSMLGSISYT